LLLIAAKGMCHEEATHFLEVAILIPNAFGRGHLRRVAVRRSRRGRREGGAEEPEVSAWKISKTDPDKLARLAVRAGGDISMRSVAGASCPNLKGSSSSSAVGG
jgi:hypothetical protein